MTGSEYDVIVMGGGGAGLMTAYSAARLGRSVAVLEKQRELGGTTALSVGTISTSATPHQASAGISDSPGAHFEDMAKFAGPLVNRDNTALRRLLVENLPEVFQELLDLGIEFVGPFPEPPHRVPRLHAIVPHARGYIHHLARACRRYGVALRTDAPVQNLTMEGRRVTGVEIAPARGRTETVRARQAVVIASGDFSSAPVSFKARFMGGALLATDGINPASTGDGQRIGEAVGGEILNGDLAWGPEIRFVAPPRPRLPARLPPYQVVAKSIATAMRRLPDRLLRPLLMSYVTTYLAPSHALFQKGAILVNIKGERFCDELDRPQDQIGYQPEKRAFILFDQAIAGKFKAWPNFISTAPGVGHAYLADYERSRSDIFLKGSSWRELAAKMAVAAETLERTIAAHNREAAARGRPQLLEVPFVALGPAKSWIVFTEGGLRVSPRLQVQGADGAPVPGLYAAGSAGQGGLLLEGHGHHLGWAFTSGRLAGRQAAFEQSSAAMQ